MQSLWMFSFKWSKSINIFMKPFHTVQDAVDAAFAAKGPDARVLVMRRDHMFELRRQIETDYADDNLLLYYNPKGGKLYHSQDHCTNVRDQYEPMKAFRYDELDEKPYKKLTRCPACAPQLRREEIDTLNSKNNR